MCCVYGRNCNVVGGGSGRMAHPQHWFNSTKTISRLVSADCGGRAQAFLEFLRCGDERSGDLTAIGRFEAGNLKKV